MRLDSSLKRPAYANSSSVYGSNESKSFSEHDNTNHPLSLYAATKKSNELVAHSCSHLFSIPATGLRFFYCLWSLGTSRYGPFLFTSRILKGELIDIFNSGEMIRDFTYVDYIAEGVIRVLEKPAMSNQNSIPLFQTLQHQSHHIEFLILLTVHSCH